MALVRKAARGAGLLALLGVLTGCGFFSSSFFPPDLTATVAGTSLKTVTADFSAADYWEYELRLDILYPTGGTPPIEYYLLLRVLPRSNDPEALVMIWDPDLNLLNTYRGSLFPAGLRRPAFIDDAGRIVIGDCAIPLDANGLPQNPDSYFNLTGSEPYLSDVDVRCAGGAAPRNYAFLWQNYGPPGQFSIDNVAPGTAVTLSLTDFALDEIYDFRLVSDAAMEILIGGWYSGTIYEEGLFLLTVPMTTWEPANSYSGLINVVAERPDGRNGKARILTDGTVVLLADDNRVLRRYALDGTLLTESSFGDFQAAALAFTDDGAWYYTLDWETRLLRKVRMASP